MNDSFKMFLIALVTAVATQLLLGPYILQLQGLLPAGPAGPAGPTAPSDRATKLEQGLPTAPAPTPKLNAPNLEGMSVEAARERWRDKGLVIIEDGEKVDSGAEPGSIIEQRPAAGSPLASKEIRVTVAKEAPDAEIPDVIGKPVADARLVLQDAGFEVPEPTIEPSREAPGTVIRQLPAGGERAKAPSIVRIVVAESPSIEVPKVAGTYLGKARKTLEKAGLTVGTIRRVEHEERGQDYVLRQDPQPGASVPPGTEVELTVVAPN
ncbi:PASTA domain-containing protein [Paraliomyxa miuraensis]|uniref:PASTA domain-containing protein n=1 Tax=Paraliomyxa miuraensis TaxID=376150 RepID=UPI0022554253|nr:PASTA domain-containing protein [Paraliomyxa miuraensis]MCX4241401.1 PASTA domain-containing protein [Paraliomyxa miuraensis]